MCYYYTSDSQWKIWLVESIQSIHNSLWTWHDKCNICCRYCIYHVKFNACLVTKPFETKWLNALLLFLRMNYMCKCIINNCLLSSNNCLLCVVFRNYAYLPLRKVFFPYPSGNCNWASYVSLHILIWKNSPPHPHSPHPFCGGGVWIFSGTAQCTFTCCIMHTWLTTVDNPWEQHAKCIIWSYWKGRSHLTGFSLQARGIM